MPSLADLLATVDDLSSDDSGALLVDAGEGCLGSVFVETGCVCWAAAAGRSARLRDLLRRHSRSLDDAALDRAFALCRAQHQPLGELLVERGLVAHDELRAALKQHTVESLIAQCDHPDTHVTWVPHRRRGYHARFTFAPAELYAAAGAELYAAESSGADDDIRAALPPSVALSASFAIGDDGEPVAVRSAGGPRVRDLIELGIWATFSLAASNGFSAAVVARAVAAAKSPTTLAWRASRRLVHAAVIEDVAALARAVASLETRGLPMVVSSHLPFTPPSHCNAQPTRSYSSP